MVLYDDEDIYREITRFKFYLLEREKEDRSILLESVTNKLLYAYFLRRNKVNKKNPKDRNRHSMLMYEMIITSIITNISLLLCYRPCGVFNWRRSHEPVEMP